MKVLLLGAGASKCAGYPLTKDLMQAIGQEAIDSGNFQFRDAWEKWENLRTTAQGRLSLMLNSPNPEICLSLLDLYELALTEEAGLKPSKYVETRDGLLECLRWFFAWRHAHAAFREPSRDYLRKKLSELSPPDVVITLNWDTTVERTLLEDRRWNPTTGYGFRKKLLVGYDHDHLSSVPTGIPKTEIRV